MLTLVPRIYMLPNAGTFTDNNRWKLQLLDIIWPYRYRPRPVTMKATFKNFLEIKILVINVSQISDIDIKKITKVYCTDTVNLSVPKHAEKNFSYFETVSSMPSACQSVQEIKHFTSFTFSTMYINRCTSVRWRFVVLDHSKFCFCFLNFHFPHRAMGVCEGCIGISLSQHGHSVSLSVDHENDIPRPSWKNSIFIESF